MTIADPLGYLITFRTYGTKLHGSDDATVDDRHNRLHARYAPQNPLRAAFERRLMRHDPIELNAERRFVVDATVREVCAYRGWRLHELNVRSNHVHVVVSARATPERVMNDLKGYGTRRMRETGVLDRGIYPWAEHGSTRYLNSEASFVEAVKYVRDEQGSPMEMRRPAAWGA